LTVRHAARFAAVVLAASAFGAAAQEPAPPKVHVTVEPYLDDGEQVEVLVDGLPAAPAAAAHDFLLQDLKPGRHVLQARILDASGNVGGVSDKALLDSPWGPGNPDLVARQFQVPRRNPI
jgi:hypothetical protein